MKIDVDVAEDGVIAGAAGLLSNPVLREIFIEIDHVNKGLTATIEAYGFRIAWEQHKAENSEYLFQR